MNEKPARSLDTSVPALIISVAAAWLVPPSRIISGISDVERHVAGAILPLLLLAVAMAVACVASTLFGKHRRAGFWGVLSLVTINVAGLLSGQYGAGGMGLLVTLVVTSPVAVVMARREAVWRRAEGHTFQ